MAELGAESPSIDRGDLMFGAATVFGLLLLIPTQLFSMLVFDVIQWDSFTHPFVFMVLIPAGITAIPAAAIAATSYHRPLAVGVSGGVILIYVLVATYLTQFYGLCAGPTC